MNHPQPLHGISNVDPENDPTGLIRKLDAAGQTELSQLIEGRICALLDPRSGGTYLDVGCGTGADTADLAVLVGPEGKVVGIDIGSAMLAKAAERALASRARVTLLQADAHEICFADGVFDGCRSERVLEHVQDPELVLREMARVTRPGGRIVVCEPDWGAAVIEGADRRTSQTVLNAWGASLRHGFIGRALPGLLKAVGLEVIAIEPYTETTTLDGQTSARGQREWDVVAGARKAEQQGLLSHEETTAWLDQLDEAVRDGRFFMAVTCFLVSGVKP